MYNGNKKRLDLFLKLHADIKEDKNICWNWTGPVDKKLGYGRTSFIGKSMAAHRVAYILAFGDYLPIINNRKTCIRHLCNNRLCVNPNHLALGNSSDNMKDRSEAGRGNIKFTEEKLLKAIQMWKEGKTQREIGKNIGLTSSAVCRALNGKTHHCNVILHKHNLNRK